MSFNAGGLTLDEIRRWIRGEPEGSGKTPLPPGMRRIDDVLRSMKIDGDQEDGGAHDGNTPGQ